MATWYLSKDLNNGMIAGVVNPGHGPDIAEGGKVEAWRNRDGTPFYLAVYVDAVGQIEAYTKGEKVFRAWLEEKDAS